MQKATLNKSPVQHMPLKALHMTTNAYASSLPNVILKRKLSQVSILTLIGNVNARVMILVRQTHHIKTGNDAHAAEATAFLI